jgi:hypothetical protein
MHYRGCSGVPGEREYEREKSDGEIQILGTKRERERTGIGRKKKREGAGCAARRERRCGEMRERETKERKEILNEDGREIGWMKAIWKSRERIEKESCGGSEKMLIFWNCIFMFVIRNRKARRANNSILKNKFYKG